MPTKDGFDPNHPLPHFLSGQADEYDLPGKSRFLKASIVVTAVTVSGIALALTLGNPVKVFADATASLTDNSLIQRGAGPSTPTIQSADAQPVQAPADAQVAAPTPGAAPGAAPAHVEMAAVAEPADQARTESNDALFSQFQVWASKQPVQVQEPVQAAPADVAENNPAPEQPMPKHRKVRSAQNAQAEIPHVQKPKPKVRREQTAAAQASPVQDARAQEQPVQNPPAPSFLQSLGLHQ